MRQETPMGRPGPKKRRSFTKEFKGEVVQLCRAGDRSTNQVAKDLGLTATAVCEWVRQAGIDAGGGDKGELSSAEKQELTQLRRDNRVLREEREILKKAAAFFAKESK
jgi:transposase